MIGTAITNSTVAEPSSFDKAFHKRVIASPSHVTPHLPDIESGSLRPDRAASGPAAGYATDRARRPRRTLDKAGVALNAA